MSSVSEAHDWWLGLTDLGHEGDWRWQHSGQAPQYRAWALTNTRAEENCATINYGAYNYKWGTSRCGHRVNTFPICQHLHHTQVKLSTTSSLSTMERVKTTITPTSTRASSTITTTKVSPMTTTTTSTIASTTVTITETTRKITTTINPFKTFKLVTMDSRTSNALPFVSCLLSLQSSYSTISVTTGSTGSADVTIATYKLPTIVTYHMYKEGFIPINGTMRLDNTTSLESLNLSLAPVANERARLRLVMNWGILPKDLDLHVTQFSNSDPGQYCETYYGQLSGCDGLYLEVDNTEGGHHGAETITWTDPGDSWYLLFVFDYSGANTTLVESQVRKKTLSLGA